MSRQYLIPGQGYFDDADFRQFMASGLGYIDANAFIFMASLALTQGAAATALSASEKFQPSVAAIQPNAASAIAGHESFAAYLTLTAPANNANLAGFQISASYPGRVIVTDAMQGGLLAAGDAAASNIVLADAALYGVQLMESM